MTKKTDVILFKTCFGGLVGLVVAIALQDWRICQYKRQELFPPYYYYLCIQDSFFKYCYGRCAVFGEYSLGYSTCKSIPWNVWGKKTEVHQAWTILMFLCLGLHFICCITGFLAKAYNSKDLFRTTIAVDFLAGASGIASMSLYTDHYDHSYCIFGKSYYFGWSGVILVLLSSMMFFIYYTEKRGSRNNENDRTALV